MRLADILSGHAFSPKGVLPGRHHFHVSRIDATPVPAAVVYLHPRWDGTANLLIDQTVYQIRPPLSTQGSIPMRDRAFPVPASLWRPVYPVARGEQGEEFFWLRTERNLSALRTR